MLHLDQLGAMIAGQLAMLTPWNLFPLFAGLLACCRSTPVDQRAQFLLYLIVPPIVVFTLTPLVAERGLPHWTMPGWFFAFPLMGEKPAFVIAYNWSIGGKVALALGRNMPVFVYPSQPKGFAFLDTSARFVGRDGVIIALEHEVAVAESTLRRFFDHVARPRIVTINRLDRPEFRVALFAAKNLKQELPVPYAR